LSKQLEFVLFDWITKRLDRILQVLLVKGLILLYYKFLSPTNRLGSFFIHDVTCVKAHQLLAFLNKWIPHVCDDLSEVRYLSANVSWMLAVCSWCLISVLC